MQRRLLDCDCRHGTVNRQEAARLGPLAELLRKEGHAMSAEYQTPEINEAVRSARGVAFALEDEYHALDWETRLDLAREMREIAADSEGRTRQLAESVEFA